MRSCVGALVLSGLVACGREPLRDEPDDDAATGGEQGASEDASTGAEDPPRPDQECRDDAAQEYVLWFVGGELDDYRGVAVYGAVELALGDPPLHCRALGTGVVRNGGFAVGARGRTDGTDFAEIGLLLDVNASGRCELDIDVVWYGTTLITPGGESEVGPFTPEVLSVASTPEHCKLFE